MPQQLECSHPALRELPPRRLYSSDFDALSKTSSPPSPTHPLFLFLIWRWSASRRLKPLKHPPTIIFPLNSFLGSLSGFFSLLYFQASSTGTPQQIHFPWLTSYRCDSICRRMSGTRRFFCTYPHITGHAFDVLSRNSFSKSRYSSSLILICLFRARGALARRAGDDEGIDVRLDSESSESAGE